MLDSHAINTQLKVPKALPTRSIFCLSLCLYELRVARPSIRKSQENLDIEMEQLVARIM